MRALRVKLAAGVAVLGAAAVATAATAGDRHDLGASLSGWEEVPVIVTEGSGTFRASINSSTQQVAWELSYAKLEGGTVQQGHIHVGQFDVNGGISVFLCSNLGNGPAGTQACPAAPAMLKGTFGANEVVGPDAQGVGKGEFAKLLRAMRGGFTYANVHTEKFPAGEVRGQIGKSGGDDGDDD